MFVGKMEIFQTKLLIGIVTSLMYIIFLLIDWFIRISNADDHKYTLIQKLWFLKTAYYVRLLIFCALLFGSIWTHLFIVFDDYPLVFAIINSGIMVSYLSLDWFQTAFCSQQHFTTSQNQLIETSCYSGKKNSFGLTVSSFGCVVSYGNWILFLFLIVQYPTNIHLYYSYHWITSIMFYLIISIIIEIYHFRIVYANSFLMISAVSGGVYGFVGVIARPTFRLLHCVNRYVICIIWFICGYKYTLKFYLLIYPITVCLWYIGSFFQRSKNRPRPKGILRKIWRKYVEFLYYKACNKQRSINAGFKPPDVAW
eukprot:337240_1